MNVTPKAVGDRDSISQALAKPRNVRITLNRITVDPKLQSRSLSPKVVSQYSEALRRGDEFPPIGVVEASEGHYLLFDGHHRVAATRASIEVEDIAAEVFDGTFADALWRSWGANREHGLKRTQKDKRRAIRAALDHPIWSKQSDRAIARHIGCDHKSVGGMRRHPAGGDFPNQRGKKQKRILPGPPKKDVLQASRLLAKVTPEQFSQFDNAELAMVRSGYEAIHRLLFGAKTLPGGLSEAA